MPGGVASGFTDVDAEPVEKRLFEVKGKRNIKIRQVNIEGCNVCKSDCWILDEGKGGKILVYMPPGEDHGNSDNGNHEEDGGDENYDVEDDNDDDHDEDNGFEDKGRRIGTWWRRQWLS